MNDIFASDKDVPPRNLTTASDVTSILLELLSHLHLCKDINQKAQEKARRIYPFKIDKLLIRATKDALSSAIQTGYAGINDILSDIRFMVGMISTKMADRVALDDVSKRSLE